MVPIKARINLVMLILRGTKVNTSLDMLGGCERKLWFYGRVLEYETLYQEDEEMLVIGKIS